MGFFSRTNSNDDQASKITWKDLSSTTEVDEAIMASNSNPQVILKHSPRCGISFLAKRNLDHMQELDNVGYFLIDVIRDRSVSQYLAEKLGIRHESPQAFVLKEENVAWHGSHYRITDEAVVNSIKNLE